jgi:hypothetical protein
MRVPFGDPADHAVGIWFGGIVFSYWLASFTLIPAFTLLLLFAGVVLGTVVVRALRAREHGRTAGSLMLGFAVYGPLVVVAALLLNLIPTSASRRSEHKVTVIGRYCIGSRQPWCRPTVNFEDEAYAEWTRARLYSFRVPPDLAYVRYTTYRGLLGATVILHRTELDTGHKEI